jgi:hypothetical protein
MREQDPDAYAQGIATALGTDAEKLARRDPDAYVALLIAAAEEADAEEWLDESLREIAEGAQPRTGTDLDYWPGLDLEPALRRLFALVSSVEAEKGAPQYYPDWFVRRTVAAEVLNAAVAVRPELGGGRPS